MRFLWLMTGCLSSIQTCVASSMCFNRPSVCRVFVLSFSNTGPSEAEIMDFDPEYHIFTSRYQNAVSNIRFYSAASYKFKMYVS